VSCSYCDRPNCPGPGLREYANWPDLSAHLSEEEIVEFINELHAIKAEYETLKERDERQRAYHRKHQAKRALIMKHAAKLLDPDELARIDQIAEESAEKNGDLT